MYIPPDFDTGQAVNGRITSAIADDLDDTPSERLIDEHDAAYGVWIGMRDPLEEVSWLLCDLLDDLVFRQMRGRRTAP